MESSTTTIAGSWYLKYQNVRAITGDPIIRGDAMDTLEVGIQVNAMHLATSEREYFPGTILVVNTDGTYAVHFNDGHHEESLQRHFIRRVDREIHSNDRRVTDEYFVSRAMTPDITAAKLRLVLMDDLGTGNVHVERSLPDRSGGYTWTIQFVEKDGKNVPNLIGLGHDLIGRNAGVIVQTTSEPTMNLRGGAYVWTRDLDAPAHAKMPMEGTVYGPLWHEQAVLFPEASQQADMFGAGGIALSGKMAVIGAHNRDAFTSRLNTGAGFAFDLRFLNLRFSSQVYSVVEDQSYVNITIHRCSDNGECIHGNISIDELPFNYVTGDGIFTGLPKIRIAPTRVTHAEGVCTSRGNGCASTATGRQDCNVGSIYMNDCEFVQSDAATTELSRYEEKRWKIFFIYFCCFFCFLAFELYVVVVVVVCCCCCCSIIPFLTYIFSNLSLSLSLFFLPPCTRNRYDMRARSDYAPEDIPIMMLSSTTTHSYKVIITNDNFLEIPDERVNLRLTSPGMQPSFGSPLWSVLTIVNDGDGGAGDREYFHKIVGKLEVPPNQRKIYPYEEDILSDSAQMGHSIASEGDFLLVGVPNSDHVLHHTVTNKTIWNATGTVQFYRKMLGAWERMSNLLLPNIMKTKSFTKFGASVDISIYNTESQPNITLALIGAPGVNAACVYQWLWNDATRKEGLWYLETELRHPDASRRHHMFAAPGSVAIDSHWAVVGASGSERVFVWKRQEINPMDGSLYDPIFIESWGSNRTGVKGTQPDAEWVLWQVLESSTQHQITNYDEAIMNRPNQHSTQTRWHKGRKVAGSGTMQDRIYITPAEFGWSVDIHRDTIVVGSPSAGYKGEKKKKFWNDDEEKKIDQIRASHASESYDYGPEQGANLHLNQEVRRTATGAVYVFVFRDAPTCTETGRTDICTLPATMYHRWHEHEIIHAPDRSHTDRFGEAISLDTDVIVVGAPGDDLKARTTWDFEQGNLVGWTRTGDAFDNQPTRGDNSNYRYVYGKSVNHGHRGTSMRNHGEGDRTGLQDELRDALYHYYGGDPQPSAFVGRYWIGTYEQNPDTTPFDVKNDYPAMGFEQGDRPQGTLTSEVFTILGDEMSFMIGGGCDLTKVYVELLIEGEGAHFSDSMRSFSESTYSRHGIDTSFNFYSVLRATGSCKETMKRNIWDVRRFIGRTGQIRIVDASSSRWAHINVDDFRFSWSTDSAKNWNASQHDTTYFSGCGQGQCGVHEGADAGAAYVFRRRDKYRFVFCCCVFCCCFFDLYHFQKKERNVHEQSKPIL